MTCCTALLTVLSTVWSVSVEEGFVSIRREPLFTPELESGVGSGAHCTSLLLLQIAGVVQHFNNACDTAAAIESVRVDATSA